MSPCVPDARTPLKLLPSSSNTPSSTVSTPPARVSAGGRAPICVGRPAHRHKSAAMVRTAHEETGGKPDHKPTKRRRTRDTPPQLLVASPPYSRPLCAKPRLAIGHVVAAVQPRLCQLSAEDLPILTSPMPMSMLSSTDVCFCATAGANAGSI